VSLHRLLLIESSPGCAPRGGERGQAAAHTKRVMSGGRPRGAVGRGRSGGSSSSTSRAATGSSSGRAGGTNSNNSNEQQQPPPSRSNSGRNRNSRRGGNNQGGGGRQRNNRNQQAPTEDSRGAASAANQNSNNSNSNMRDEVGDSRGYAFRSSPGCLFMFLYFFFCCINLNVPLSLYLLLVYPRTAMYNRTFSSPSCPISRAITPKRLEYTRNTRLETISAPSSKQLALFSNGYRSRNSSSSHSSLLLPLQKTSTSRLLLLLLPPPMFLLPLLLLPLSLNPHCPIQLWLLYLLIFLLSKPLVPILLVPCATNYSNNNSRQAAPRNDRRPC